MSNKESVMLEGFATLPTPEWLLSSVNSEMLNKKGFLAEGLATFATKKAFLQCVSSGVD